jgi:hypothetical protein
MFALLRVEPTPAPAERGGATLSQECGSFDSAPPRRRWLRLAIPLREQNRAIASSPFRIERSARRRSAPDPPITLVPILRPGRPAPAGSGRGEAHWETLRMTVFCRGAFLPAGSSPEPVSKTIRAVLPTPIGSQKRFHQRLARGPPVHLSSLLATL